MRSLLASGAAVLAATIVHVARADDCSQGAEEIQGNWYCQAVTAVQYSGLGVSGSYSKIANMDSVNGACSGNAYQYSGSLSPLDEEVSIHIRGPAMLKQFAVYTPSSSSSARKAKAKAKAKRDAQPHAHAHGAAHGHAHGHGHAHFHNRNKEVRQVQEAAELEKRQYPEVWVTATIDGQVVSWINNWYPETMTAGAAATTQAASTVAAQATPTTFVTSQSVVNTPSSVSTSVVASSTSTTDNSTSSISSGANTWTQIASYEASSGVSSGLTFLNHFGGIGSGTFDYVFGNSLSYSNAEGTSGAAASTTLADVMLPSNAEIVIMTDVSCDEEEGCGYYRPGNVAYHGFDGAEKLFLLEFQMPNDGTTGWNMNMPAIWMLNAQIPRTLQYGAADCSCWSTGCGELDLFEVLDSGSTRCKSTYHGNIAGGDSDYFVRPENQTIKAAVTMNGETATIKIISDSFQFPSQLSSDVVAQLASSTWADVNGEVSLFDLD